MKKTLLALAVSLTVVVVASSSRAYADGINLGPADQGGYYSQADPGIMIFTGDGSGGFSSVYWNGWIGLASGPGAMSGAYSVQGNGFVAGAPAYGPPGPPESWSLTDLGNSFCYDDNLNDLCSGVYALAYLTFGNLSGSPSLYQIFGTVWAPTFGSLAPFQDNFYAFLDTGGVDLAGLANGATATATILNGAVVPEPGTFSLVGLALTLIGLGGLRLRNIQA